MTLTQPLQPVAIVHDEAEALARTEYDRFADLVATVTPDQWSLPTDCAAWTVRDLVGHVVGAMRSAASARETVSVLLATSRRARRTGEAPVDAMTATEVERTAGLAPADLVAECRRLVGPAARGRARTPAPVRRWVTLGVVVAGEKERWTLGYLNDVILTRDTWMHRVDLSRAIGVPMVLTPEHDRRIVADVAAEWASRHGRPARLTLTGPAGGEYAFAGEAGRAAGTAPEEVRMDAVEFCRALSGRDAKEGPLATEVPF